jgi:hypothetical protein
MIGNRPAEPCGAARPGGEFGGLNDLGRFRSRPSQPVGQWVGVLGAKVSCQPLGVSCQMSLLG